MNIFTSIYICLCVYMYICISQCMYIYISYIIDIAYMFIYKYICNSVTFLACILGTCMYMYIYVYTVYTIPIYSCNVYIYL